MFGKLPSGEKLIQYYIKERQKNSEYFKKASQGMSYDEISDLVETAILEENIRALVGLAETNKKAVARMFKKHKDKIKQLFTHQMDQGSYLASLYYLIRKQLPTDLRVIFQRLASKAIIKSSLRIAGRGIHGDIRKKVIYHPNVSEIDTETTIENYMEDGHISQENIIGIEKLQRKRAGVLILDTSGSMYREKIVTAALAVSVLSYNLRYDDYAIVTFSNDAKILKSIRSKKGIEAIIRDILEITPVGYTNITSALDVAHKELQKIRNRDKWAVLVSDGSYNLGDDPKGIAAKFQRLHVISVPSTSEKDKKTCKNLAKLGKGNYAYVKDYSDVPRTLMKVIR